MKAKTLSYRRVVRARRLGAEAIEALERMEQDWASYPHHLDLDGDDPIAVDLRKIRAALRFLTTENDETGGADA